MGFLSDWWRSHNRLDVDISEQQWQNAEASLTFLGHLSPEEHRQLRKMAREFIASKEWDAAAGLVLTPAIQISIALQACLPVLHLGLERYAGWVGIVVYPGDFVIPRSVMDEDGVVHEFDDPVLGEAWEGGPVLLSWFDDRNEADGVNVVIHEFAHKLDMGSGGVDGMPHLPPEMSRQEWVAAFEPAFIDFQRRVDGGEDTALDPYGAESPAEFFAVMSEAFFETPDLLEEEYPAVAEQLRRYYRQNPARR
ncbi:MAG: zinc-dependent peptidase [Rhodocyclaceae bacterium]|nr:zinc-dependent peptidase [Rhodocyclaceae bacterium]